MLIISRKIGESFIINDNIEVYVLDVQSDRIKIGIDAPKNIKIIRKELAEIIRSNLDAVDTKTTPDYDTLKDMVFSRNL